MEGLLAASAEAQSKGPVEQQISQGKDFVGIDARAKSEPRGGDLSLRRGTSTPLGITSTRLLGCEQESFVNPVVRCSATTSPDS